MDTMIDSFYKVLKDATGVDLTIPVNDPVTQYQIDSKEEVSQLSSNRSYERIKKQGQRIGKPQGQSGTPSLYVQAAQAASGNTLLNRG